MYDRGTLANVRRERGGGKQIRGGRRRPTEKGVEEEEEEDRKQNPSKKIVEYAEFNIYQYEGKDKKRRNEREARIGKRSIYEEETGHIFRGVR